MILVLPNVTIEPSNVRKNKETTECDKSTVTCDIGTALCENGIIKCNGLVIWYSRLSTRVLLKKKKSTVELPVEGNSNSNIN